MTWTDAELAGVVARDLPRSGVVNLGIGLPLMVADAITPEQDITLHSENGIFGAWRTAEPHERDDCLVNAGKQHIALGPGAAITDQVDSFALVRAGYIDVAVLGAYQVSAGGDLANWKRPGEAIAGVGGAVDIAHGARDVWVMMRSRSKDGTAKMVRDCTFPLTARGVVTRVYTELGVLRRDCGDDRFRSVARAPGVAAEEISSVLGVAP